MSQESVYIAKVDLPVQCRRQSEGTRPLDPWEDRIPKGAEVTVVGKALPYFWYVEDSEGYGLYVDSKFLQLKRDR